MSADEGPVKPPRIFWDEPSVDLNRIQKVVTFEVMEDQLDQLDEIVSSETRAVGFASITLGIFSSTGLGWLAATGLSPWAYSTYMATLLVSGILTLAFALQWNAARRQRPKLLQKIRSRTVRAPAPSA